MSQEIVRSKLSQTLKVKSLDDLVRAKVAENPSLLIDVSGSMDAFLRNGKTAIDVLRGVVMDITKGRSEVMLIAFGGRDGGAYVVSSVPNAGGGTPLHKAIDLAREKKIGRAIVISDGCPDNPPAALEAAKIFGGQIDVVYIGDPGGYGEEFLKRLAESTGGAEFTGDLSQPKELTSTIIGLLEGGTDDEDDEPRKAVQL